MRYGICTGIENLEVVEKAGYDYIEFNLSTIAALDEQEFLNVKKKLEASSLKSEGLNFFFAPSMKIVGPGLDEKFIADYIVKAVDRAALLGAEVLVVGCGKSRYVPEGWNKEEGIRQYADALRKIGEAASKKNITIVIEAIRKDSTNIVNSLKEAMDVYHMVNHPNVYIMADYNQMSADNESMDEIIKYAKYIKHLHIADRETSYFPLDVNHKGHKAFMAAAKKIGYDAKMSIEVSRFNSWEDAAKSLKVLKTLLAE